MLTHNICFHGEIRKILCGYPLLSVAMIYGKMCRRIMTKCLSELVSSTKS